MSVISLRNAVIVAGALAIMGAGKTLVLNANELDLQYQKLVVPKVHYMRLCLVRLMPWIIRPENLDHKDL